MRFQFFGLVLHHGTNLRAGAGNLMSVLSLLSMASSSLGLAIGSIFQVGDSAMAIGPALMVIYVIVGAIGPAGTSKQYRMLKLKTNYFLCPLLNDNACRTS